VHEDEDACLPGRQMEQIEVVRDRLATSYP